MRKEKSCGSVVFLDDKVLLVKHNVGHWDFPKGHMENGETEEETAIREVKEETNIDVKIDVNKRFTINYNPEEDIEKEVVFFKGKALNTDIKNQEEEIETAKFVSVDEARMLITYENSKNILEKML